MKQVLQHARSGEVEVMEVPRPGAQPACVLVQVMASLVSAGTERASTEFASKSLLQKARSRPDLVRNVLDKIRRDGLFPAVQAVRSRLDQPLELGYSSAGIVTRLGEGMTDLRVGDRVACAGAGYAVHAEMANIPRMLVARIPSEDISFEEAAFTTIGAVALHGIRVAEARLGDVVAVIGIGLLGQLTVQLLKAAGCCVIGMDINPSRVELAQRLGADAASTSPADFSSSCLALSKGYGVDSVLITAATPSSEPVNLAGSVARERAIVVALGTVGMEIDRKIYYEKELQFRISRSYGPGRYDTAYEQKGLDYPIGYVRWTETRNMEAFLQLLAAGKLDVRSLVTHRLSIEHAERAYEIISGKSSQPSLGILLQYSAEVEGGTQRLELVANSPFPRRSRKSVTIGLLGAGSFALSTLLPAIRRIAGVDLVGVCSATASHSQHAARKFGFQFCTTDERQILDHDDINTVIIATRHHLHARQVLAALSSGKNVFCEKPLCLSVDELTEIVRASKTAGLENRPLLMVGFNRRFAPLAIELKKSLTSISMPLVMHYRVNAGQLPGDHWVNDPEQGGGRILGEACHFIDFLTFLAGAALVEVNTCVPGGHDSSSAVISLTFANGSQGTISYLTNGDRSFSKERIEVFGGGTVAVLEDFRWLEIVRDGRRKVFRSWLGQNKGHAAQLQAFACAIREGEDAPVAFEEIVATMLATFRALDSISTGKLQFVGTAGFIESCRASRSHEADLMNTVL
ncbi:MAG TPA: bi-domain-containing oxidoreductase [Terriglobales bacterium]|nr:bi-domain-containing oxidoreductase [Terriglobales bacterium]